MEAALCNMAMNYLVLLLCCLTVYGQDIIIIKEVPQSLLIPTGHVGTFTCKSCCTHCHSYWVIDGIPTANRGGRAHLESMGFVFSESHFNESNQLCHMMTVTINATESVNASSISCDYCPTTHQPGCRLSDVATLLVIASSPVIPNPIVTQTNTTHLTLLWSPPFLWPGERISHYHVLFSTKAECTLTQYILNSNNFSDQIVSLTINESRVCAEFKVFISATDIDASELRIFNVTGQIMPSKSDIIGMSSLKIINISIYFAAADGEPALIEVYIQVPICHSLPLNYTISFGSAVLESGQIQHHISDFGFDMAVVNKFIKADLQVNRSYWMNVTTNIYSQNVQASDQWTFNTSDSIRKHKLLNATEFLISYQVAVIIFCLFIAVLLFLAPICVIACTYWNRRVKKKKCIISRNGINKGMVVNPIYDGSSGPVYDSIMTQPERIQSTGMIRKIHALLINTTKA